MGLNIKTYLSCNRPEPENIYVLHSIEWQMGKSHQFSIGVLPYEVSTFWLDSGCHQPSQETAIASTPRIAVPKRANSLVENERLKIHLNRHPMAVSDPGIRNSLPGVFGAHVQVFCMLNFGRVERKQGISSHPRMLLRKRHAGQYKMYKIRQSQNTIR